MEKSLSLATSCLMLSSIASILTIWLSPLLNTLTLPNPSEPAILVPFSSYRMRTFRSFGFCAVVSWRSMFERSLTFEFNSRDRAVWFLTLEYRGKILARSVCERVGLRRIKSESIDDSSYKNCGSEMTGMLGFYRLWRVFLRSSLEFTVWEVKGRNCLITACLLIFGELKNKSVLVLSSKLLSSCFVVWGCWFL